MAQTEGSIHYQRDLAIADYIVLLVLQMQGLIIYNLFILPLQFDYEGFVYECFDNGDTFPVLESLVIRNLKLSTEEPLFDNCKYTYLLTNLLYQYIVCSHTVLNLVAYLLLMVY